MLRKYPTALFCLGIILFGAASMMPKETSTQTQASDSVSVNAFKLRFIKENGRPVDFRAGEMISSLSTIAIRVNEPYVLTKVNAMLVRGKRPVSMKTYSGEQEIIIEKSNFTYAQEGDRLNIEFESVQRKQNGKLVPVVLDVPVFNIPLN